LLVYSVTTKASKKKKKRLVLDLDIKVKAAEGNDKEKLTGKQTVAKFNVEKL